MTDATSRPVFDHARIAEQNDAFRRHVCLGGPWPEDMQPLAGRLDITDNVLVRGQLFTNTCLRTTGFHNSFPKDADPNGIHAFGVFRICDVEVWWKLDCYDQAYERGADDPADPSRTARVLTILLPLDW
ncbi:DUF3768 domain-containing protein [uncultured Jannaschia sp.]|uniref:DUF3768 domain-containing protein n=1 Tax=uncultured Jannaschia sp. TaxID=293347 RepID=UPI002618C47A|nr:DUF3768 domain-containing protein [uncultured Jannaschia sp.]